MPSLWIIMKKTRDKKEKLTVCPPRYPAWRDCGRGFTLLELMISIVILAIMISAAIVSLLPARNRARLKAVQAEVATTIKTIQSYALQGKVTGGSVPAGYGFKFTGSQQYVIFYCDTGQCGTSDSDVPIGDPFSIQDRGVTLTVPADPSNTRFYFDVPNGNLNPPRTDDLVMTLNIGGVNKNVTVKKSGSVLED